MQSDFNDFDYNDEENDYFNSFETIESGDHVELNDYLNELNPENNVEEVNEYDSEEFTSFISSGYGTTTSISRPSSTVMEPSGIISSLHLDIPELEPILSSGSSPTKRASRSPLALNTRAKMTDLGFKMSKVIMSTQVHREDENDNTTDDLESGDKLVDNYGQAKKRQKTGVRGRPKGSSKVGTQFGRASSTHALPPNVSALMGQANLAYVQKQYPRAIELYLQVVQRAPASPEPYYSLGLVHEEQGDVDKAASYFLITAHLQPRADRDLWRRIAALLVQVPRKEQAVYCLTRAIKAPKPAGYRIADDFPLFWLRAKLQLERAEYRSVITGFATALRGHFSQDPEDLELFILVARLAVRMSLSYLAAGMFENVFRSAVQAALPLTWSHLNILVELGEVDGDHLAVLSAIEEFAVPCYLQSGREQGRTDWLLKSSQEQLQTALESAEMPAELKLKLRIAQIHLKLAAVPAESLVAFLKEIERPGIKLKLKVADALSLVNAPLQAVQLFLECLEEDSTLATSDMCLKIGQNYRKAGELEMAVESFLAVLQVDPEHRATRLALSEVYRSLGKNEQALQVLPSGDDADNNLIVDGVEKEKFINWDGLNELFVKVLGIGIEINSEDVSVKSASSESDSDSEVYKEKERGVSSSSGSKLRFGPERQKRRNHRKVKYTSAVHLRTNYRLLMDQGDRNAGGVLLQHFSENIGNIPGILGELTNDEWNEALLKVLILQAAEFSRVTGKSEWDRLIRIMRSILASPLRVDVVRWRVLGLVLAERAGRWNDFMIENVKSLLGSSNGVKNENVCLLPSGYLQKSADFVAVFYHASTFRFLNRLNLRLQQRNPALLVLLGHQSLETQNYEDAAKMYARADELVGGEWRFLKLCMGNALLGRAFQRTCANQLARLTQALGYFMQYYDLDRDDMQACFNVGRAFHQAGFLSQALQFYKKCIVDGDDEGVKMMARYNLSRLYLQSGSPGMAKYILRECENRDNRACK